MDTIHLPQDFREFLKLLNFHKAEYLLIGGFAVGYHGYPRATGDMDIWIAVSPDGIRVSIISSEHLKINKKASGRLKDLNDLEYLS
jgi:hypothetical protein